MLRNRIQLRSEKKLKFWVSEMPCIVGPYQIYWKVLNRGEEAQRRNCIRGQIVPDNGHNTKDDLLIGLSPPKPGASESWAG
jgi:hypothetical protein